MLSKSHWALPVEDFVVDEGFCFSVFPFLGAAFRKDVTVQNRIARIDHPVLSHAVAFVEFMLHGDVFQRSRRREDFHCKIRGTDAAPAGDLLPIADHQQIGLDYGIRFVFVLYRSLQENHIVGRDERHAGFSVKVSL